jgi:hypothetical protein
MNTSSWLSSGTSIKSDEVKLVYSRFFLFNKNNRKRKSHDLCKTMGQWSVYRPRKGINKPKRDNVLPWDRKVMGEWNDLVLFTYEIRNVPFNIQFYISIIRIAFP